MSGVPRPSVIDEGFAFAFVSKLPSHQVERAAPHGLAKHSPDNCIHPDVSWETSLRDAQRVDNVFQRDNGLVPDWRKTHHQEAKLDRHGNTLPPIVVDYFFVGGGDGGVAGGLGAATGGDGGTAPCSPGRATGGDGGTAPR